jgi:hypothetical protein
MHFIATVGIGIVNVQLWTGFAPKRMHQCLNFLVHIVWQVRCMIAIIPLSIVILKLDRCHIPLPLASCVLIQASRVYTLQAFCLDSRRFHPSSRPSISRTRGLPPEFGASRAATKCTNQQSGEEPVCREQA